jgi:hypothetical protein
MRHDVGNPNSSRAGSWQAIALIFSHRVVREMPGALAAGSVAPPRCAQSTLNVPLLGIIAHRTQRRDQVVDMGSIVAAFGKQVSGHDRPFASATTRSTRFLSSRTSPSQPCYRAASLARAETPTALLSIV